VATQQAFADAAQVEGLLVAEHGGAFMGVGTSEELQALIADGILPEGTTLRAAVESDF
jgi:hypothetical protein